MCSAIWGMRTLGAAVHLLGGQHDLVGLDRGLSEQIACFWDHICLASKPLDRAASLSR